MKSIKITTLLMLGMLSVGAWAVEAISSISPNKGPITGGQRVRIRLSGFTAAPTTVTFGSASYTVIAGDVEPGFAYVDATVPAGTGTVNVGVSTATLTNGYTYIARNNTLQVQITATIAHRVLVQWGANTIDSAGTNHGNAGQRFTPFLWTVVDSAIPLQQLELGTSYRSDDAANARTIVVENQSSIAVDITAAATASAPLILDDASAADEIRIGAAMGAATTFTTLSNSPSAVLADEVPATGGTSSLVLEYTTPPSLTNVNYATAYTATVTLTAQVD